MVKKEINKIINNPYDINEDEIKILEDLVFKYPYFQSAQLLLARGLLNTSSIRYNKQLKKASIYCLDREYLFKLITHKEDLYYNKKETENLIIGQPLRFKIEEKYSFSEWLNVSKVHKINRKEENEKIQEHKIIDTFIDNYSISERQKTRNKFFKANIAAKESLIENEELITPTLAKVYLEQGHYDKAIYAYQKLCLKYPEKNSLFAKQIKSIKKIKE